jgi:hypothetical protein
MFALLSSLGFDQENSAAKAAETFGVPLKYQKRA